MEKETYKVKAVINADTSELDAAEKKVDRLIEKIKEAKTLADELASLNIEVPVTLEQQSQYE